MHMKKGHHIHRTQSGCGSMSRRLFLGAAAGAGVAAPMVAAGQSNRDPAELGEYVDLAELRPKPEVRIVGAVIRQKPPYWLGWPGTAYDVEGHRKEYEQNFKDIASRLGVGFQMTDPPLESDDAVTAFVNRIQSEQPDAVLVHIQHLSYWKWANAIAEAGLPTIVFSPIGTSFTHHVVNFSRQPNVHVISSLSLDAVEQAFRMIRAKKQMAASRVLVVRGDERKETVLDRLGTKVRYVPRDVFHEMFAAMPATDEAHEIAREIQRVAKKIVEPNEEDCVNAARSFLAGKRLVKDEASNAITTDCLGMVTAKLVPTPPCMAASIFQDHGVTYGCEADLFAAISLMFVSYLFDRPGFQQDPVAETYKNVLVAAHCTCGTRLNGFDQPPEPVILRSHSESDIGVATQVLWKEGQPVTLVRFQNPDSLILDTGTIVGNVQTPPAGGCRTSIEIDMDRVEDARDVIGFHQVVFYGDHRRDVEAFCQMNGINVVNSPERAPREAIS